MPTVAIDVKAYKALLKTLTPETSDAMALYNLEIPDWICDHCGHISEEYNDGEPCPRCHKTMIR